MILRRLSRWQAEELREDLADLHVESWETAAGGEYSGRQEFLTRLAAAVRQPGFVMVVAESNTLVGCAFGFPVGRDGVWWRGFDGGLPRTVEQLTASGHVFAITEVTVHPYARDQGLFQRLQAELLAGQEASFAATLVDEADRTSYSAFRSTGWQEIGEAHWPSGAPARRALLLPLGNRAAGSPGGLAHNARTQRPEGSADSPSMPRAVPPESP
ncbi:hypothetical protein [Streptacidiphilus sp. MAP12-20]|uniref:hypothetical protein n=1 Tax=Streptacidiphilus sp. MAP12-20 TaxID=3156299 RepID=UPI003511AD65